MEVDAQIKLDKERKLLQMQEERRIECQKQKEILEKNKKESQSIALLNKVRKFITLTDKVIEMNCRKSKKVVFTLFTRMVLDYETLEFKINLKKNDRDKKEFVQYLLLLAKKRIQSRIEIEKLKEREAIQLLVVCHFNRNKLY